jgi:membrane fusion protein, multidrug efflux system
MRHDTRSGQVSYSFRCGVCLSALMFLSGCGGSQERSAAPPASVQGIRIEMARLDKVPDEIEAPGTVVAFQTAEIAARVPGTVTRVAVREGDRVQTGQLLLQLDDREMAARSQAAQTALQEASAAIEEANRAIASAQAQADIAKKTYERFVFLRDQKSVSPQEFDEVETKQKVAQEGLAGAQARHQQAEAARSRAESEGRAAGAVASYTAIAAPFTGVVARRMVDVGTQVSPGTPLLVFEDDTQYRFDITLDAAAAPLLKRGASVRVELDALQAKSFEGKVSEQEAGADATTHTVRAKVDLPHAPGIRSGLFGHAWIVRGVRTALLVPGTAVRERGQLRGMFVLDSQGIARWRLVTVGQTQAEKTEILSGLGEGERYAVDPGTETLDGKKVASAAAARSEAGN